MRILVILRKNVVCLLVLTIVLTLATVSDARAQTTSITNLQAGAWGDEASRGNKGVRVEIRTHISSVVSPVLDNTFWVGDNLQNGAFIQFGYIFEPGRRCLYSHRVGDHNECLGSSTETLRNDDPRWFWEYFPNATVIDFYKSYGPTASAGPDGSWHLYAIEPNVANGWNFVFDGKIVQSFNTFHWAISKDPVYVDAEEVTSIPSASGKLGPVEFRNLSYLKDDGWHQVESLRDNSGCSGFNPNCDHPNVELPYGVTLLGPNHIMAGTGQQLRKRGAILWTQQVETSSNVAPEVISNVGTPVLGFVILLTSVVVIALVVLYVRATLGKKQKITQPMKWELVNGYCIECGKELPPQSKFCTNCGTKQP